VWVGPAAQAPDGQLAVDGGERVVVWRLSTDRPRWADF
jgi:hypothetical protein